MHCTPCSFQLGTDGGVFVSCLKVNSSEEEKEALGTAFPGCTATIYVEEMLE